MTQQEFEDLMDSMPLEVQKLLQELGVVRCIYNGEEMIITWDIYVRYRRIKDEIEARLTIVRSGSERNMESVYKKLMSFNDYNSYEIEALSEAKDKLFKNLIKVAMAYEKKLVRPFGGSYTVKVQPKIITSRDVLRKMLENRFIQSVLNLPHPLKPGQQQMNISMIGGYTVLYAKLFHSTGFPVKFEKEDISTYQKIGKTHLGTSMHTYPPEKKLMNVKSGFVITAGSTVLSNANDEIQYAKEVLNLWTVHITQ